MSVLEQTQVRDRATCCSRSYRKTCPFAWNVPPPCPPELLVNSELLFPKSQLKSSILFQTSQLSPPQAGRFSGSLVSLLSPGPFAYPWREREREEWHLQGWLGKEGVMQGTAAGTQNSSALNMPCQFQMPSGAPGYCLCRKELVLDTDPDLHLGRGGPETGSSLMPPLQAGSRGPSRSQGARHLP